MRNDSADKSKFSEKEKKVLKRFKEIFEKSQRRHSELKSNKIYASLKLDQGGLREIIKKIDHLNKRFNIVVFTEPGIATNFSRN